MELKTSLILLLMCLSLNASPSETKKPDVETGAGVNNPELEAVEESEPVAVAKIVEETSDSPVFQPLEFSIEKSWDGAQLNHSTKVISFIQN